MWINFTKTFSKIHLTKYIFICYYDNTILESKCDFFIKFHFNIANTNLTNNY